jgi:N-acetylglutamate synthase-like GNAT family acetyltransferase
MLEQTDNFAVLYDRFLRKRIVITKDGAKTLQLLEKNGKAEVIELLSTEYNEPVATTSKKVEDFIKHIKDNLSISDDLIIRNPTEEDIVSFSDLISELGSDPAELKRTQSLQPECFFVAVFNGMPIGMIGCPIYEPIGRISWLMVLQDARNHGIGSSLVKHAVNFLDRKKVSAVLLNASTPGANLFSKFNFIQVGAITCMRLETQATDRKSVTQETTNSIIDEICNYDYICTGLNRNCLLEAILKNPKTNLFIKRNKDGMIIGYLVMQKNLIGPWISASEVADDLLKTALANVNEKRNVKIFMPYANEHGRFLLERQGFREFSCCVIMCKGKYEFKNKNNIYAITSLADG